MIKMCLSGLKLVTFDVTNTLLKFRVPTHDYYALVAQKYGFKGTGNDIKKQMFRSYICLSNQYPNFGKDSISWNEWWNRVVAMTFQGHQLTHDEVENVAKQLIDDFKTPTCWRVVNGTENLIQLLKKSGITVGVISNFDPRLHEILSNLNIKTYFDFIITSYDLGICKPSIDIFKVAQARGGCHIIPSQCLHIGDDLEKDYRGAKAAGWHALLINDKIKEIQSSELRCVYSNLNTLLDAIETSKFKI